MKKLKKKIKGLLTGVAEVVPYYQNKATILNYHRVCCDSDSFAAFNPAAFLSVSKSNFERQMKFISERYDCMSMDTFVAALQNNKRMLNSIIITFDDGYYDNIENALPVLERYNIPALIYVTSGFVTGESVPWWTFVYQVVSEVKEVFFFWEGKEYNMACSTLVQKEIAANKLCSLYKALEAERQARLSKAILESLKLRSDFKTRMMSESDLKELSNHPLITIGAHSLTHPVMSSLDREELDKELMTAKSYLERITGKKIKHFAYPYGRQEDAGKREETACDEAGYESAVSTVPGHFWRFSKANIFSLPRIDIDFYDTMIDFSWKLSGLESLIWNMRSVFKK